jgi:ABC-type uncharacterized transport system permease subunit
MNITTIVSTTHAPQTKIPLTSSQCAQDYATLQNALQAGDLAASRGAYEVFWQAVATQAGPAHLFLSNAQTGYDLQAVGNSLNSANISGAKRAFAMFQKDMLGGEPNIPHQILRTSRPTVSASAGPRFSFLPR